MHFSQMNDQGGTKFSKLAIVAALHVALGAVFIHSLNTRSVSMPKISEDLVVMLMPQLAPQPPPPPPAPPTPTPKAAAAPKVIAPPVEVQVQQPPQPNTVVAEVSTETAPQPSASTPAANPGPATAPSANAGIRSVALADASGCATPTYPTRAARNNESGTVTLALLVGADGKVSDSRIKSSSGSRELDKAAVAALSSCTFKPAMNGGVAEPGWAQIAYVWTLE